MRALSVLALAVLALGPVQAQDFVSSSTFGGSVSQIEVARAKSSAVISNASASAKAVGRVDFLGPGGRAASATLEAQISRQAVLTAAAKSMLTVSGYGLAAVAAWEVYNLLRVRKADTAPASTGGLVYDEGVPREQGGGFVTGGSGATFSGTQSGSCSAMAALIAPQYPTASGFLGVIEPSNGLCYVTAQGEGNPAPPRHVVGSYSVSPSTGLRCPAAVDPFDPSLSVPAGVNSPGPDGLCPTGRYTVPKTAQEAADMAAAASNAAGLDLAKLFRESIGFGIGDIPADAPKNISSVTPTSVPGATSTTTNPDGTSTEVSTVHEPAPIAGFQTTRFQAVPWWQKTTTTTLDASGQPTGSTVTTNKPGVTAEGETGAGGNGGDPCATDPGRLGCIGLGQIPEEPQLPTRVIAASADPDTGWGSFTATCPAAPTLSAQGRNVSLDNSQFCNFLSYVRFILVSFASLVGIRILLGGLEF